MKTNKEFLRKVDEFVAYGEKTGEEEHLDAKIREAGLDPEAFSEKFAAVVESRGQRRGGFGALLNSALEYAAAHKGPAFAACAALLVAAAIFRSGSPLTPQALAAETLAAGAKAMSELKSVHITARMRTLPRDNFELIGTEYPFVDVELWKRFGAVPAYRVEKPGRVVVMDGSSATLFIKPDRAAKGGPGAGFVQWLQSLLQGGRLLESELALASQQSSKVDAVSAAGADGREKLTVTIRASAQGDFSHDWLHNTSVTESDNTRVYVFDAATKRLESLKVSVDKGGVSTPVFEITGIEYDLDLPGQLFSLALPPGVSLAEGPAPAAPDYANLGPSEAARAFLEALAGGNWAEASKFYPRPVTAERWGRFAGLKVVSVGDPFKSGLYAGRFVPYEIIFRDGTRKKHNLALRNDNKERRYLVDGGI